MAVMDPAQAIFLLPSLKAESQCIGNPRLGSCLLLPALGLLLGSGMGNFPPKDLALSRSETEVLPDNILALQEPGMDLWTASGFDKKAEGSRKDLCVCVCGGG